MNTGRLSEHIRESLKKHNIASLSLAVIKGDDDLWEAGFGWANRATQLRAGPHVAYSLASISKPFTATALMVLVDRGLVDLDAPINEYLGDAKIVAHVGVARDGQVGMSQKEAADRATVRLVANHSSGLPLHYHFFHDDEPWRRPPMDLSTVRYGHLCRIPGERYVYANFGYGLLDYVIERVSGMSYGDFLTKEVLHPLGMTRAAVGIPSSLVPFAAERYDADGNPISFYDFDHPGASAVYCSAHDLVRFGRLHLKSLKVDQKCVLSGDAIDQMQVPTIESAPGQGYGIGWRIVEDNHGYRTVNHDGGMGGVRTRLMLVPEEGIAVAVLCSGRGELPAEISDLILGELCPGFGQVADTDSDNDELNEKPPFISHPALAGTWRGSVHTYNGELPLEIVVPESGPITVRCGNDPAAVLEDTAYEDELLTGTCLGDIGTDDAAKRAYTLAFSLTMRWNVLNGSVTAVSKPGARLGNALSHWCELEKTG